MSDSCGTQDVASLAHGFGLSCYHTIISNPNPNYNPNHGVLVFHKSLFENNNNNNKYITPFETVHDRTKNDERDLSKRPRKSLEAIRVSLRLTLASQLPASQFDHISYTSRGRIASHGGCCNRHFFVFFFVSSPKKGLY